MNAGQKIHYCLKHPIHNFDDLTNSVRWELFPNWVCGMDDYIDDVLQDENNWEAIVDALGLYDEQGHNFVEELDCCSAEQWYEVYAIFIDHMHFYFDEWVDVGEEYHCLPADDMKYHFRERAQEYRRVRHL